LEDDSGRIRLIGDKLKEVHVVTGCIVAIMGTENVNGEFQVMDIKLPDLAPQPSRWSISKPPVKQEDKDTDMSNAAIVPAGSGSKIAIVSGLSFSSADTSYTTELNLLTEFLLGEALDRDVQEDIARISRLIIAGNSISTTTIEPDESTTKHHKKYGYDASAYNPAPSQLFDSFLSDILPSLPVTLLPGKLDPSNAAYPQQPIHTAMFPQARAYAAQKPGETGWFDPVTNPWEGEVDGWRFLGTGGQNVDDVFKYSGSEDRLGMMEAMCRWRCSAPTAPDTLCEFIPSFIFMSLSHQPPRKKIADPASNRELPLPRRRPLCHWPHPPPLLCRLPAPILHQAHHGSPRPDGPARDRPMLFGDEGDRAGGHGDIGRHKSQDFKGALRGDFWELRLVCRAIEIPSVVFLSVLIPS
jgi:DNA polymerase delta subunit 2